MSAQSRIIDYLKNNIGRDIPREELGAIAAPAQDWTRGMRSLRQNGWDIETTSVGYILHSDEQKVRTGRSNIPSKLRYATLQRDNSTCQRCGRTIKDGIKLEVDHKLPVDWNGTNDPDNLWTLCNECNGGKKNLFSDFDDEVMRKVMAQSSGTQRLRILFAESPNVKFEVHALHAISKIRDWTRTIRLIRETYKINIQWVPKTDEHPFGFYINKQD